MKKIEIKNHKIISQIKLSNLPSRIDLETGDLNIFITLFFHN